MFKFLTRLWHKPKAVPRDTQINDGLLMAGKAITSYHPKKGQRVYMRLTYHNIELMVGALDQLLVLINEGKPYKDPSLDIGKVSVDEFLLTNNRLPVDINRASEVLLQSYQPIQERLNALRTKEPLKYNYYMRVTNRLLSDVHSVVDCFNHNWRKSNV